MLSKVRVWDLPTRLFHWGLVVCFCGLLVTGEMGGDAMVWHFRFGYTVLSLLLFRLIWGFIGGFWSRFQTFVVGPATTLQYLRGQSLPRQAIGHNPLGSWSVLAMLAFSLLQVAAGLCSDDEIATAGPLVKWVSSSWVGYATLYHTKIGKFILIVLVQLHVAAIIFYRIRHKENLLRPMLTGDKTLSGSFESARDDSKSWLLAGAVMLVCAVLVLGLLRWVG